MRVHRFAMVFAALSLCACASGPVAYVSVAYTSSPAGAVVERDGVTLGRTPMTLMVKAPLKPAGSTRVIAPGCLDPGPVTFKWVSGATAIVSNPCQTATVNAASIKKVPGSKSQYTASVRVDASRPADVAGLQRDQRTAGALGWQTSSYSSGEAHSDWWRGARSQAQSYNTSHPGMGPMSVY